MQRGHAFGGAFSVDERPFILVVDAVSQLTRSPHSRRVVAEGDLPWSIASLDHRAGASAVRRGACPKARPSAGGGLGVHCPPLRSGLFTPSPLRWTGPPGPRRRAMTRDLWSDWASERGPGSISGGRVRRHPPAP